MIAGQKQTLLSRTVAFVVNGQRKHASHAQQKVVAVVLVHAKHDFCV